MKTIKSIVLGLALLVVCGTSVNATAIIDKNDGLTKTYAVNTYVNAMTRGKLDGFNDVLDKSARFSMLRGKQVLNFDKKEMMQYMQKGKNVSQACTTSTSIVESNDDAAVIRVDMQYDNFVRSNYLTIANTGNGWKITKVYSVFK
ncbi:nuclear transport factor 2 family protein [Mucilaginibacter pallidiroseus]|uniref:Nuclear transport factor 2 family protein n=1 Tax=Mucilaginibacter pallidiroseus TaxID=2599295 RepID=A0A563U7N7_9SPHI|nr:nuclear transport factor 2 family protein [Mucilaginibacter pallidiroseus]TWR27345.1 nuclear transport factor 2 family protein [Mucilaginibacter pallidiroseus]